MSVNFKALLFYGMPIEGEPDFDLIEKFNESQEHLEITNLSPMMEDSRHFLFVRASYQSADDTSDEVLVPLSNLGNSEGAWRQLITNACVQNGLTWTEPGWYFATSFS